MTMHETSCKCFEIDSFTSSGLDFRAGRIHNPAVGRRLDFWSPFSLSAFEPTREILLAFRFEKASCLVLGTFNTYILHPRWLADRQIIDKGTEVQIEMNFEEP